MFLASDRNDGRSEDIRVFGVALISESVQEE